ncbi:TetR family transcriptional regulator [Curtobacterium sp. PhB172]|uniref:TetR/AcrR family transcriptional regulator n=1 Tax=unclassified Curtobacterium TaxID=257496 RepID=UPI000F4943E6|nr:MULTISPECIES: TetR/AcrR family transcriptional regulator [unclassified Curtobacterium]ROQ07526.1 TetR family transcriptional regulator [Curtobacterium sp. PhB171]ROQ23863.1 TetR family transcriptional regulator [Curtobacterium sp. PhB170]ROS35777.1 TetR family transcriptional regulator [Curtobacterium sp. PhB131]ROS67145.1 TetR family transcriptional regulator [Curtobacterium sp. PhB172]ROS69886.1 TetR family transcriptional regulator [Curtobacterium sp. PhB141]
MTERPFHHGNLRAVLLDEAVAVLRESGVDGLSLRDLARRAGVSHGAPRSHFVDRQALLDALAELGFDRLTAAVRRALSGADGLEDRFRRVALAYVDFAIDDAALMDLMFQAKTTGRTGPVQAAAESLFAVLEGAVGTATTEDDGADARLLFKLLFAATMQGIATLVVSHRIDRAQGERLVDAALETMLGSELGNRVVGGR